MNGKTKGYVPRFLFTDNTVQSPSIVDLPKRLASLYTGFIASELHDHTCAYSSDFQGRKVQPSYVTGPNFPTKAGGTLRPLANLGLPGNFATNAHGGINFNRLRPHNRQAVQQALGIGKVGRAAQGYGSGIPLSGAFHVFPAFLGIDANHYTVSPASMEWHTQHGWTHAGDRKSETRILSDNRILQPIPSPSHDGRRSSWSAQSQCQETDSQVTTAKPTMPTISLARAIPFKTVYTVPHWALFATYRCT